MNNKLDIVKGHPPELHLHIKGTGANAKWEYGLLDDVEGTNTDPDTQVKSIKFGTGLDGWMYLLKEKIPSNIWNFTLS
jgi:hypothetical protein